jgi:hypothetical protein
MTRPLSRCIELRALEHDWNELSELRPKQKALEYELEQIGHFPPPEWNERREWVVDELKRIRAKRLDTLQSIKLEHLVEFHGKSPERYSTSTAREEQAA